MDECVGIPYSQLKYITETYNDFVVAGEMVLEAKRKLRHAQVIYDNAVAAWSQCIDEVPLDILMAWRATSFGPGWRERSVSDNA